MKYTLLFTLLVMACCAGHAQDALPEDKSFQKEKLFMAGNFGLAFGDYTLINISPQLGYRFNKFFAAGAGINGQYVRIKDRYTNGDIYSKSSRGVAGLNIFGRVYPIQNLMLQLQPEANYVFGKDIYYDSEPRQVFKADAVIAPSLLAGAGLVLPSGRGATIISLFYDVLQHEHSPYGKKSFFNIGANFGF